MASNNATAAMVDVEQPLLAEEQEEEEEELPLAYASNPWPRRVACFGISVLFLVLAFAMLYLIRNGAFSRVERDVRIANGTVIEPNTKLSFPLHRARTLQGQPGPERLVGLMLKTKHVPEIHATMRVFVLALYVDRAEARKVLLPYQTRGCPDPKTSPDQFEHFYQLVSSGKLTVTLEYRLIMSPPGTQMYDHWLATLVDLWKLYGADAARVKSLTQCFYDWFRKPQFKNGDVDVIQFTSRTRVSLATHNAQQLPVCKDEWMGRSIVDHEFLENGQLLADLLPTLWNKEYDNDDNSGEGDKKKWWE